MNENGRFGGMMVEFPFEKGRMYFYASQSLFY
jgi:hypothetical protein